MGSIIDSVRTYLLTYPDLEYGNVNVDYLGPESVNYTVDSIPTTAILSEDVLGNTVRQFQFVIGSREAYGSDTLQNMANSGWYEAFSDWLDDQTEAGVFPILESGKTPIKIFSSDMGYLMDGDAAAGNARYQIQCTLIYEQQKG